MMNFDLLKSEVSGGLGYLSFLGLLKPEMSEDLLKLESSEDWYYWYILAQIHEDLVL